MEELLTALVLAAVGDDRVTWIRRPQGDAVPATTLQLISGPRDYHLTGRTPLTPYIVQADCWATTYGEAKTRARAIEAALGGYTDASLQILINDERDDDFRDAANTYYRTSLDLRVWHKA